MLALAGSHAASAQVVINGNETTPQNLAAGETIQVTPTGNLNTSDAGTPAITGAGNNTATIDEGGRVQTSSLGAAPGIQFNGGGTVNLSGRIETDAIGLSPGIFFNNGIGGTVNVDETGRIITNSFAASPGIFSTGAMTVNMDGRIQTNSFALSAGINVGAASTVDVGETGRVNSNGNSIDVGDNSTVTVDGRLVSTSSDGVNAGENATVTVGETGRIEADDDGVDVEDNSTVTMNGRIDAGDHGVEGDDNVTVTVGSDGRILAGDNGMDLNNGAMVTLQDGARIRAEDDGLNVEDDATITIGTDALVEGDDEDGIEAGTGLSLTNDGTIRSLSADGVDAESITSLTNNANGRILGDDNGVEVTNNAGTIINAGLIQGDNGGVEIGNDLGSLTNTATGRILSNIDPGVVVFGNAGSITNLGLVESLDNEGITVLGDIETLANEGTVRAQEAGVNVGNVGTLMNSAEGRILGTNGPGVYVDNDADSIQNMGLIRSELSDGVWVNNDLGTLTNGTDARIIGGDWGLFVTEDAESITNDGLIKGESQDGVFVGDDLGTLVNSETGRIISDDDDGLDVDDDAEMITNAGLIRGVDKGLTIGGDLGTLDNSTTGRIRGMNDDAVSAENAESIQNDGTFTSDSRDGLNITGDLGTLVNSETGRIIGNGDDGVDVDEDADMITNAGTIRGDDQGITIGDDFGTLVNTATGRIVGANGDGFDSDGSEDAVTISNAGVIRGGENGIDSVMDTTITNSATGRIVGGGTAIELLDGDTAGSMITNQGTIRGGAGAFGIETGDGDDTIIDVGGLITNDGGSQAIHQNGGNDLINLTGSTVFKGNLGGQALRQGTGDDTLIVNGFADFRTQQVAGNGGTDTLKLNLWGLTAADVNAILAQAPGTKAGGVVTFDNATDMFTIGDLTYSWASYEMAQLCAVNLAAIGTPNQRAIGAAINPLFQSTNVSPDMQDVLFQIIEAGPAAWPEIANRLSPQDIAEAFTDIGFNNAGFQRSMIRRQTQSYFFSGGGGDVSTVGIDTRGLELIDPTQDIQLQRLDRRLASLSLGSGFAADLPGAAYGGLDLIDDSKTMYDPKQMVLEDPRRFGIWLAGQGILADVDQADGDLDNFHYDSANVTLGGNYRLSSEWVAGAFFNWGYTDAAIDGRGSRMEVNTYQGGLYTGWDSNDDGWFVNGYAAGGVSDYNQTRTINFGTVNRNAYSDPDGWQFTTSVNSGYMFDLDRAGNWQAGPIWGVQYTHLNMDGFTENGAGALNLTVGEQDADSFRTALGGQIQGRWQLGNNLALVPTITAEWLHEFLDDSRGITGAFNEPAAGSFIVNTRDPDRDFGLFGAGVDLYIGDAFSVFVSYDAQVGGDYFGQAISGGARYEF